MQKNTSSVYRIDERVFATMAFFSIVFLLILIYSYGNYKPCEAISISYKAVDYYTGSLVSFKAETNNGETYAWDFGDSSEASFSGSSTTHSYGSPGNYKVNVMVNGRCKERVEIVIKQRPVMPKQNLEPKIVCPATAYTNRPVTFRDTTHDAKSWEWFFDQSSTVDNTNQQASWIFTTPGLKSIFLRVNGRPDMEVMRYIQVFNPTDNETQKDDGKKKPQGRNVGPFIVIREKPKTDSLRFKDDVPFPPTEVRKMAPDIQADEMEALLEEVVTGSKTAAFFSKYLCNDLNIPVIYNNKPMTFNEMCNTLKQIRKLKKIKRPIVLISKNKSTGCIVSINVTVNKEGLFESLF